MEDILPSRRQAVVDRLRRRIEFYRRHQEGCYPRYNQTSQGLYEQQRHETLTLKQRFLETKAKKVRKNDHKAAKDQNCVGNDRNLLVAPKLNKRTAAEVLGSPVTSDGLPDDPRHPSKIARNSYPSDQGGSIQSANNENKETQQPSSHTLPSFSVQIVQQFSSSSVAHVQHSQTIQTNVTVKALNGAVKTTDSPLATASSTVSTDSPTQQGNGSISVGTNIECKQEKKLSGQCCNHSAPSDLPNLDTTSDATSRVERYSDTFSNFNFPDDSGDDVFHPDLLKDLIEDVFTNPSDLLMFEDSIGSVKDSVDDEKDSLASTIMDMGKLVGSPSTPQQFGATSLSQRSAGQSPHSASSLFDLGSTINNNSSNPAVSSNAFPPSSNLSGLGLDFKLTEPSPAALTLKQMAEQHQNMQQKQQQKHHPQPQQQSQQQNLNLRLTSPSSQNNFSSDNFSDPLTSMRSSFLNTTQSGLSQVVQKPAIYQTVSFSRQPSYQGSQARPNNGMIFKQENFNANSPIDIELHKRQTIQQQINDQKPPLGIGQVTYGTTRPLSHYTEPVGGQRQNQTFLRAQGPGITPPPTLQYGSSNVPRPRSAASSIHMSQSQQIQINQNTQHLQVSQEQQMRLDSAQTTVSANQQQSGMYVNYPHNPSSAGFRMSQMQNVTFNAAQFAAAENANLRDHQSVGQNAPVKFVSQQRPPPPEYATHVGTGAAISVQQQQRVMSDNVRGIMIASQNQRVLQTPDRRSMARTYQEPGQMTIHQGNMVPHFSQQDTSRPDVTKPIYTNALTKNQRPPNVSIGPDGLNVSQRPSCLPSDWRNNFIPSQQMGRGQAVRVSYIRPVAGQPTNYNPSLVGDITQNCDPPPVRVAGTDTRIQRVPHPSVSSPVTHRMTSSRTYGGQMTTSPVTMTTNHFYDAVQLPVSTSSSAVDNGHFDLTFLDTLDCSTSDLFSLEQAIQDSANSPFPLLEDMTLLGK